MRYFELKDFNKTKIMIGGRIPWATTEYIENIIMTRKPDTTRCNLISDIVLQQNEGRHNHGIAFVNIEGEDYFLKYHDDLLEQFKTGYYLSRIKPQYPYFLEVYSLLGCNYITRNGKDTQGQVMIVEKGTETIYKYLNRKSMEYFLYIIPDLHQRVQQLDERIKKILDDMLTAEEKQMSKWELENKDKEIYDAIRKAVEGLIKEFYLSLSKEIIQFQTEFVPLFILNYKALIDSFMIPDMFTLFHYQNYVGDKKSDNFMVKTEPYTEGKTHVEVNLGSTNIKIRNLCKWHNVQEFCFLYPVDFDSCRLDYPKLDPELLILLLNIWIYHFSKIKLYSDNNINNLEFGNILNLKEEQINFNFSIFGSKNKFSELFVDIFTKYNPFKIIVFNPLFYYHNGMQLMVDDSKFAELYKKKDESDLRFIVEGKIIYENITLEDAFKILAILLNGNTVIFDKYLKSYRGKESSLNFNVANGLPNNEFLDEKNVFRAFLIRKL
jgi:hypothetical protein